MRMRNRAEKQDGLCFMLYLSVTLAIEKLAMQKQRWKECVFNYAVGK